MAVAHCSVEPHEWIFLFLLLSGTIALIGHHLDQKIWQITTDCVIASFFKIKFQRNQTLMLEEREEEEEDEQVVSIKSK